MPHAEPLGTHMKINGHSKEVAEVTVRRICESRGINVSDSLRDATSEGVIQKIQIGS